MEISRPVGVPQCGAWGGLNSLAEGGPGHSSHISGNKTKQCWEMSLNNPIAPECTWEFPIRNYFLCLQASKYLFLSWMQLDLSFLSGRNMHCTR